MGLINGILPAATTITPGRPKPASDALRPSNDTLLRPHPTPSHTAATPDVTIVERVMTIRSAPSTPPQSPAALSDAESEALPRRRITLPTANRAAAAYKIAVSPAQPLGERLDINL